MIVNEDYKNWHLAYYCKNFIMKNIRDSGSKYCIIHENNKYINFWVKDMANVTILETLSVLPTSDYYIICCKIENPDYKRILSYCKNIIDIYQDYHNINSMTFNILPKSKKTRYKNAKSLSNRFIPI